MMKNKRWQKNLMKNKGDNTDKYDMNKKMLTKEKHKTMAEENMYLMHNLCTTY